MWFIFVFWLIIPNLSYATGCDQVILDDFEFSIENNEIIVSPRKDINSELEAKFIKSKSSSRIIKGHIEVRNKSKKNSCFKKSLEIDPIKLCRDVDNNIESWRFVTYGDTDVLSIVSLSADIDDPNVVLNNSRICRDTNVQGNVFIYNSHLLGGNIVGSVNSEDGPGIPDSPKPEIPRPWDPTDNKELNFNFFTVKLSEVEIQGSPTISGNGRGIFLKNTKIINSPQISDQIYIENSTITGNGSYSGKSFIWDQKTFVPIIKSDLSGDNNFICGVYLLEREIHNSIIKGAVSVYALKSKDRNNCEGGLEDYSETDVVDVIAYVSPHSIPFSDSFFLGFGHIEGSVQNDTNIQGYQVGSLTYGVFFLSGAAKNSATIEGAVWIEDSTIENATVHGTHYNNSPNGHYGMEVSNSIINDSYVSGNSWIINANLYLCAVYCDAYVTGTHMSQSFGGSCAKRNNLFDLIEKQKRIRNAAKKVMDRFYSENEEIRKESHSFEMEGFKLFNAKLKQKGIK